MFILASVNELRSRILSWFFIAAISFTMVPMDLFHGHHDHEEEHCHDGEVVDACHVALYHSDEADVTCAHESHFTEAHADCELCDFITNIRHEFDAATTQSLGIFSAEAELNGSTDGQFVRISTEVRTDRGPPALLA